MLRLALLSIAALLAVAASASAQATSSARPGVAGEPTRLRFDVDAAAGPLAGRVPAGFTITAPAGFVLNPRAFPQRCAKVRAQLDECPATSRFGSGSLLVQVTTPEQTSDVRRGLVMYRGAGSQVWAVVDVFGRRAVPGRLETSGGVRIAFDPLPALPAFPGVSYLVKQVTFDVGGTNVVRTVRRVRGKGGKARRVVRTRREPVLRAPATCPGSWPSSLSFRFEDGTVQLPAPTPCRPGR
jgi:hypothetical protein